MSAREYVMDEKWEEETGMIEQNSFGVTREESKVTLTFHVKVWNSHETSEYGPLRGCFEFWDNETGGDEWYAEGGLWFTDGELTDYDGVFSLSSYILEKLNEHGFDVAEMTRVCEPTLYKKLFGGEEE